MAFCQLWLTCKSETEANEIAQRLLEKRLVACVRQIPTTSSYRWKGKIDSSKEVMLLMESKLENFREVEVEVAKLHSYETFVLEAVALSRISKKAENWLGKELK